MFAFAREDLPGGARKTSSLPVTARVLLRRPIVRLLALAFFSLLTSFFFFFPQTAIGLPPDAPYDLSPHNGPPHDEPPPHVETPPPIVDVEPPWASRKAQVRDAYIHALKGYKEHAFPSDELMPVSGGKSNK